MMPHPKYQILSLHASVFHPLFFFVANYPLLPVPCSLQYVINRYRVFMHTQYTHKLISASHCFNNSTTAKSKPQKGKQQLCYIKMVCVAQYLCD